MFRRRRADRAEIARLTAEVAALRTALADLGRQWHGTQPDLADTARLPRVRSEPPPGPAHRIPAGAPVGPWRPE